MRKIPGAAALIALVLLLLTGAGAQADKTVLMPFAGDYDFAVSTWGTLSACVSTAHPFPFSGSGNKGNLHIPQDNTIVRVTFDYMTNEITTEMLA